MSYEKNIYSLGVYHGHNATVALLKNGEVLSSVSEERFTGKKNFHGFPQQSIDFVLQQAKVKPQDLNAICLPLRYGAPIHASQETKKSLGMHFLKLLNAPVNLVRFFWQKLSYFIPALQVVGKAFYNFCAKTVGRYVISHQGKVFAQYLGVSEDKVIGYDHHLSHAAAAYYLSPYNQEDALVLSIDGEGDTISSAVRVVRNGEWELLAQTDRIHSLGVLYSHLTEYLGMKALEHEYKVMGLAPYAKTYGVDEVYEKIQHLVTLDPSNPLRFTSPFDMHRVKDWLFKHMKPYRFDNIAAAFQRLVEERLCEWVQHAVQETGLSTVCIGGGVAMNVKANMKISQLEEVKKFFVCPTSGDESTPIGACFLSYREWCSNNDRSFEPQSVSHLYWGPSYSQQDVASYLDQHPLSDQYRVEEVEDIESRVAQLLADGAIVARVRGAMEWGARALGNRSILANPKDADTIRVINETIKMRDFWMPFTPSMLKECADEYIVNPKGIPASFMATTFDSTEKARSCLKAAMHPYDFTVRPQLVDASVNPSYHKLISAFREKTGIGAVLNTSFNLHGLPIVKGPQEAFYALEHSGLQYLAIENFLIEKVVVSQEQSSRSFANREVEAGVDAAAEEALVGS